jgi:hypothetical protein
VQGGTNNQAPAEQVCEARRMTEPPLSRSMRQGERPNPCQADPQGRNPGRRCRPTTAATRRNITKPRPDRKASGRHDGTPLCAHTDIPSLTCGAGRLQSQRPQQRSLYSGPYVEKDEAIPLTERIPTHA